MIQISKEQAILMIEIIDSAERMLRGEFSDELSKAEEDLRSFLKEKLK